jgi:hypothetical protein
MVYRNTANGAPQDVGLFETIDKAQNVIRASAGLPVIKLLRSHFLSRFKNEGGIFKERDNSVASLELYIAS